MCEELTANRFAEVFDDAKIVQTISGLLSLSPFNNVGAEGFSAGAWPRLFFHCSPEAHGRSNGESHYTGLDFGSHVLNIFDAIINF